MKGSVNYLMFTSRNQPDIRLDVLELVQNLFEQPAFTSDLIAIMDADLRPPMTALHAAVQCNDPDAANVALEALTAALEG